MTSGPLVSVFTPSHRPHWLGECYASLHQQTYADWEWVVVLNAGAHWEPPDDPRVRVIAAHEAVGVGSAKHRACAEARGDLLVELDHDDVLLPTALERVVAAYDEDPDIAMVYSHCAQVLEDGSRDDSRFDPASGWECAEVEVAGRPLQYAVSMAPTPHNVSYIWFAPNHLRAFSRTAYDKAGGYDATRTVLDDQDLMCRLYQVGAFHLIDEVLYLQRMHPHNTQRQAETNAYIEANALAWARRAGLLVLDLGAAHNRPEGYLGVDQYAGPFVDLVATLPEPLRLADSSVGVIRAVDFLEHVADKVAVINELHRLLAPGGMLLSMTPSTDGRGAFQDPTHVAFYNENSFWYYTEPAYRDFVPDLTCRFQTSRLVTHFPSEWHRAHDIPYVTAHLIAIKDGTPRHGGPLLW